jgi:V/A-type H+-transporting ATPase subunit B
VNDGKDSIRQTRLLEIVGDTIRVRAKEVAFGDIAVVENVDGETSIARVVELNRDIASLQVFAGGRVVNGCERPRTSNIIRRQPHT